MVENHTTYKKFSLRALAVVVLTVLALTGLCATTAWADEGDAEGEDLTTVTGVTHEAAAAAYGEAITVDADSSTWVFQMKGHSIEDAKIDLNGIAYTINMQASIIDADSTDPVVTLKHAVYNGEENAVEVTAAQEDVDGLVVVYATELNKDKTPKWVTDPVDGVAPAAPGFIDAGEYTVYAKAATVEKGEGDKITAIKPVDGDYLTLTFVIDRAPLTVYTPSAEMAYDGTTLTASVKSSPFEGLVKGETVGFKITGAQTEVGQSDNTIALTWADDQGMKPSKTLNAKQANYDVTYKLGKLTVYSGAAAAEAANPTTGTFVPVEVVEEPVTGTAPADNGQMTTTVNVAENEGIVAADETAIVAKAAETTVTDMTSMVTNTVTNVIPAATTTPAPAVTTPVATTDGIFSAAVAPTVDELEHAVISGDAVPMTAYNGASIVTDKGIELASTSENPGGTSSALPIALGVIVIAAAGGIGFIVYRRMKLSQQR